MAAGRGACQRAARVLRDATALSGDTPPAPRLRWQLWALRPGLDGRPGRPRRLPGRSGGPGFRRVRRTGAAALGHAVGIDHGIVVVKLHTSLLRGSVFGVAKGSVLSVA